MERIDATVGTPNAPQELEPLPLATVTELQVVGHGRICSAVRSAAELQPLVGASARALLRGLLEQVLESMYNCETSRT